MRFPTNKEVHILNTLAVHTNGLYGFDLIRKSNIVISKGSVYFILDRMKQQGWVDVRLENPPFGTGGKQRRVYIINTVGQQVLDYVVKFNDIGA